MFTELNFRGYDLEIEYNFYPAERQTRHYPGNPEDAEITSIKLAGNDTDLWDLFNQTWSSHAWEELVGEVLAAHKDEERDRMVMA